MPFQHTRRTFLRTTSAATIGLAATRNRVFAEKQLAFEISVAQWSLHRAFFGTKGDKLDHLEFAHIAREKFDIGAIEYSNHFFKEHVNNSKYLAEMDQRAKDCGVQQLLIMIDGEGKLGDPNSAARKQAIHNHHKWVDAAAVLGCHSIRVNAASEGSYQEQLKLAADGLARLTEYGAQQQINVIVENHGGLSSNGKWLAAVLSKVGSPHCGSLPDFGNFGEYDRYQGVRELMPFAKAISAKSHDFDPAGNETHTDYVRMLKIVMDASYNGYVGIEYEGSNLDEYSGVLATKKLLDRVRGEAS